MRITFTVHKSLLRHFVIFLSSVLCFALLNISSRANTNAANLRFEVTLKPGLVPGPQTGRLLVILSQKKKVEPRFELGSTRPDGPFVLGCDANELTPNSSIVVDEKALCYPLANLSGLPKGNYFIQALLLSNVDIRSPSAPGNLYSLVTKFPLDASEEKTVHLELSRQIGPGQLPAETDLVKFVKIQSTLLSKFHGRPIYLRAGIILPRDYSAGPSQKYPLWVRIGGLDVRYTDALSLMDKKSSFRKTWMADGTPRFILLQLDGAGPYGDCYQVNSDNNGPYGDAITQELILHVEKMFRAIGKPNARVLSGHSTGGWSSLALQIFYPDYFNGVWSSSPDSVDFRAFELVNIYEDENAYVNKFGFERPSERTIGGDTRLTMRRELLIENVMGRGNNWTLSGGQWCAWNATYGPRGKDGLPVPLWDPVTGAINPQVAKQWQAHDLSLILRKNWKTLSPKLQGRIHISVGDADNYFLNNAVHLLDEFLSHAEPPYQGRIVYGPGKGHGWSDISLAEMLMEMKTAVEKAGD